MEEEDALGVVSPGAVGLAVLLRLLAISVFQTIIVKYSGRRCEDWVDLIEERAGVSRYSPPASYFQTGISRNTSTPFSRPSRYS